MNRRTFINRGWAWTGLLIVPTVRALPPIFTAAVQAPNTPQAGSGSGGLPSSGLIAHWPLTNAAQCTDSSGNGHNGTAFNSFGNDPVNDHNGLANGALKVNSIGGQYATFPSLWTTDWSLAMWLLPDADAAGAFNRIIGQTSYITDLAFNDPSSLGYNLLKNYNGGSWVDVGTDHWIISAWNHLGLTFNHTGPVVTIYFNGVSTATGSDPNFTTTIYLGADYTGASAGKFSVSQMILYDRVLSAGEMLQIHDNT